MAATCQDLCSTRVKTVLDLALLIANLFSFLPQILVVVDRSSTYGLSFRQAVLNVLFTTSLLSSVLAVSCWQFPVLTCIAEKKLCGMDAFGAVLGLLQVFVVWLGSLGLLTLFVLYSGDPPSTKRTTYEVPCSKFASADSARPWNSHKASLTFIATYIVIFLLPVALIALPTPSRLDFGMAVYIGVSNFYHVPATLVLVTTQFLPEIALAWRLRYDLKSTSISVWTLGLQMVLFALLGISWRLRLGTIGTGRTSEWTIRGPIDWYWWIGWRCFNYVLFAIGQAVLFAIYILWGSRDFAQASERESLLPFRVS